MAGSRRNASSHRRRHRAAGECSRPGEPPAEGQRHHHAQRHVDQAVQRRQADAQQPWKIWETHAFPRRAKFSALTCGSSSPVHPAAPCRIGRPRPPGDEISRSPEACGRSQKTSHEIARAFLLPFLTRPARRIEETPAPLCAALNRSFLKSRSSVVITVVYASGRPAAPRHRARCFRRASQSTSITFVSRWPRAGSHHSGTPANSSFFRARHVLFQFRAIQEVSRFHAALD